MAKVKSAGLRNYVGRLGGSVYYMNRGQNIGRELAPEVSNPRTPAQMRQRMKWANLVNIYKANRSWMGHLSFENKPQTWSDYNAFMSANIGANPVYLTKGAADNGDAILAPYTMTKGSLPTIEYAYSDNIPGLATSIKIETEPDTLTVGELSQEILDNNPEWQFGDQLSVVLMYKGVAPYPIVVPIEIIINPGDETPLSDIDTQFAPLSDILTIEGTGYLAVAMDAGVSYGNQAACVIHSRTTSGRTKVSTQAFMLNPTATTTFQQMGTDEQFEYAAASYGVGSDYFLATDDSTPGGGGGGSQRILSFSGTYIIDDQGAIGNYTITPGGPNTLLASAEDAPTTITRANITTKKPLVEGEEYILAFIPTGSSLPTGQSNVATSDGTNSIQFQINRTPALAMQRRAGIYYLCVSDEYQPDNVQAFVVVTASS